MATKPMKLPYRLSSDAHQDLKAIRADVERMTPGTRATVVIDFTEFDSPDSMFLGLLLQLHVVLKNRDIPLQLTKVGPRTHAILRNSTMDRLIHCIDEPFFAPMPNAPG